MITISPYCENFIKSEVHHPYDDIIYLPERELPFMEENTSLYLGKRGNYGLLLQPSTDPDEVAGFRYYCKCKGETLKLKPDELETKLSTCVPCQFPLLEYCMSIPQAHSLATAFVSNAKNNLAFVATDSIITALPNVDPGAIALRLNFYDNQILTLNEIMQ